MAPPRNSDFSPEVQLIAFGYRLIAGVDEAGRGPLAGPVVAAAVIFPAMEAFRSLTGLTDSKRLTPRQRECLYGGIVERTLTWAVASVNPDEIDRINILQASLRAMAQAICALNPPPDYILVDGNHSPARYLAQGFSAPVEPLVKGDARSLSVAAASILAKVTRDRLMLQYDAEFPEYGFARHKGYPSPEHLRAIARYGVCPIHRRTFRGVREHCEGGNESRGRNI